MGLYDLINYYNQELSSYNMVFQNFKILWFAFVTYSILLISLTFPLLLLGKSLYLVLGIIVYIVLILILNLMAKKVIKKKYELQSGGFIWGGYPWEKYRKNLVKEYLRKWIIDREILKEYIGLLYREKENVKKSNYILIGVPGLFLALFLPIWTNFNSWLFNKGINDMNMAISYLVISLVIVSLICIVIGLCKSTLKELTESKSKKIEELIFILEDIHLTWDDKYFKNKIVS